MSNWKDGQRWVCRHFGMECGWRGEEDECRDVDEMCAPFAPEVKYRKSFPQWLTGAWKQALEYAERVGKVWPIVVLMTKSQNRMKSLVIMDLEHFDDLIRLAGLQPTDRNKLLKEKDDARI